VSLCQILLVSAHAAVTGTVINGTTGKPQPGATVGLNKLGQANGIELVDQAATDAQGRFTIDQPVQGPHLIRTAYDGVTYNHMLPPGSPTTDLRLEVYNASKNPGDAKVTKHMILLEPSGVDLTVNETLLLTNTGKTAWNDATGGGTVQFYLPAGANGKATVNATAPGGMPIGVAFKKTSKPDIWAIDFPVKPGESRIDIVYTTPYTIGQPYSGKVPSKDDNTYLIAPQGVTITGAGLNDLGNEPRTQAHIYGISGNSYKVTLTGIATPSTQPAEPAGEAETSGGPEIQQIMPRLYRQAVPILAIALGILALGFAVLYRSAAAAGAPVNPKEVDEQRGRG
jgi:hypothetical protein